MGASNNKESYTQLSSSEFEEFAESLHLNSWLKLLDKIYDINQENIYYISIKHLKKAKIPKEYHNDILRSIRNHNRNNIYLIRDDLKKYQGEMTYGEISGLLEPYYGRRVPLSSLAKYMDVPELYPGINEAVHSFFGDQIPTK